MIMKEAPSHTHRIWIAGDYHAAVQACREFVLRGLCVSVQPADYVFTMGMESGVCVTLINYPRFPASNDEVSRQATTLGGMLCERLHQGSFTVEGPKTTTWHSRRPQDQEAKQ